MSEVSSSLPHGRVHNFNAGPSVLPVEVLEKAQSELLNWRGSGQSVMEMSHRGAEFTKIIDEARQDIRDLLDLPPNYKVLFSGGGASNHFSAIPLNLIGRTGKADYVVTGAWSEKAVKEARKYGDVHEIPALIQDATTNITTLKEESKWELREDASYVYFCANETISGVDIHDVALRLQSSDIPLVVDFSSSFMSHPIDVTKFGVIFAGAQKNVGPAGLTIVIVREDLFGHAHALCPQLMNYQFLAEKKSVPNTPPCFNIYMSGLVFKWLKDQGGLTAIRKRNETKSSLVYEAIDKSNGFFHSPVSVDLRSLMNVSARIRNPKTKEFDSELEAQFVADAKEVGIVGVKGHRSVGGLRFSIYNALPLVSVEALVNFMTGFQSRHES